MHHYSQAERAEHLSDLIDAIEAFLPELERSGQYRWTRSDYENACSVAKQLLASGFNQEELNTLSRGVPRLFWVHKEWVPPLEPTKVGSGFAEPEWFQRLDPLESKVSAAAEKLRVIGEY
jgi:hypothetical protein